jgi:predicted outer membrane protein
MMRSIFVAAVLCAACTHQKQVPLDAVTTTSATIRTDRGPSTLEPGRANDEAVASMPSQVPSSAQDDARIAAAVEAYDDAAVARAKFAMGRAKDSRVKDYAQLVYDRHHEAKMRLSSLHTSPATAEPPTELAEAHAQPGIDFDRVYVETEAREQSALLQLLDSTTPETKTVEMRQRLMDLRPQVADLWVRGYELAQILAAP